MKVTRMRKASGFQQKVLGILDDYSASTGITDVDLKKAAAWALSEGKFELQPFDKIKHLARIMQQVSRQEYIEDDNGEPVRRRHAYKVKQGDVQLTLWAKMEEITPRKMRYSAAGRRRSIQADVFQLHRDVSYYNVKHNPGEPIQLSFNFDNDLEEKALPVDYVDSPPDEEQSDG